MHGVAVYMKEGPPLFFEKAENSDLYLALIQKQCPNSSLASITFNFPSIGYSLLTAFDVTLSEMEIIL